MIEKFKYFEKKCSKKNLESRPKKILHLQNQNI